MIFFVKIKISGYCMTTAYNPNDLVSDLGFEIDFLQGIVETSPNNYLIVGSGKQANSSIIGGVVYTTQISIKSQPPTINKAWFIDNIEGFNGPSASPSEISIYGPRYYNNGGNKMLLLVGTIVYNVNDVETRYGFIYVNTSFRDEINLVYNDGSVGNTGNTFLINTDDTLVAKFTSPTDYIFVHSIDTNISLSGVYSFVLNVSNPSYDGTKLSSIENAKMHSYVCTLNTNIYKFNYTRIQYPQAITTTSYGIVHTNLNNYKIVGGYSWMDADLRNIYKNKNLSSTISIPVTPIAYGAGFITNYNSSTQSIFCFNTIENPNLRNYSLVTHVQGICNNGNNNFTLSVDEFVDGNESAIYCNIDISSSKSTNIYTNGILNMSSLQTIKYNQFEQYIPFDLTGQSIVSNNSTAKKYVCGILVNEGTVIPYQALIE